MTVLALFIETIDGIAYFAIAIFIFSHLSDIISAETLNFTLTFEKLNDKIILFIEEL